MDGIAVLCRGSAKFRTGRSEVLSGAESGKGLVEASTRCCDGGAD